MEERKKAEKKKEAPRVINVVEDAQRMQVVRELIHASGYNPPSVDKMVEESRKSLAHKLVTDKKSFEPLTPSEEEALAEKVKELKKKGKF